MKKEELKPLFVNPIIFGSLIIAFSIYFSLPNYSIATHSEGGVWVVNNHSGELNVCFPNNGNIVCLYKKPKETNEVEKP